ncbi:MAG: LptF/LptG family permease [Puniceicoccales bacterium]|jgi:lipopolysaccharide export system permease protein|nr:LptF/LptG family permease [Puniceicoccales bacterium]
MNRLQRYMFLQVAQAVLLAVGFFVFVLVTGSLLKEVIPLLSNGMISWGQFAEILFFVIPGILPYALPIGLLTGVLIVLGRMSAQNEILVMKAAGISLWRLASPVFLIAIIGVIVSLVINFEQAPRALSAYKRIIGTAARANPSRLIAPGQFTRLKKHVVHATTRTGDRIGNPWIWEFDDNGRVIRVIHADSGQLNFDVAKGVLKLTVVNARLETLNRSKPEDFSSPATSSKAAFLPVEIPLDALLSRMDDFGKKKLRYHTLGELLELRKTGWNLKPNATPAERFASRIGVQLQIQSNLASAFGILSMSMLAIPLGIKTSRSETFVNIAIALALALSFYVLTVAVSWIKTPVVRPDLLVWLPNFLYQGIACVLLWKTSKN